MRILCAVLLLGAALAGYCVTEHFPKFSSGAGFGALYGGVGINVEEHFDPRLSAAFGSNPFSTHFYWTAAGLYHPDADNPLRFSVGLSNALTFFNDAGDRGTRAFFGVGWAPTREDDYRGWNIDIIIGEGQRTASLGYAF